MPEGETPPADASLHLPAVRFRAQLDLLERHAQIVPVADLLAGTVHGTGPFAALTFDDAYRGAVTVGLPELARRGHPATLFVTPGCLGGGPFWWDRIGDPKAGGLPAAFRERALTAARGRSLDVLGLAAQAGLPAHDVPAHALPASVEELQDAARAPGLVLGAHTWTHPNLAALHGVEFDEELVRPLTWLHERFERVQPWIAYPYGLLSPEAEAAVERAGYAAGFLVAGGWLPQDGWSRYRIPRLDIPAGLSEAGFIVRLAGLMGA